MAEKRENSILSINGILEGATNENNAKLSVAMPDFSVKPEKVQSEEIAVVDEAPADEAAELVKTYSGKAASDPQMNTRRLRELLEAQIGEDSVLLDYYNGKTTGKAKGVSDIRAIIDEKTPAKTKPTLDGGEERFSDEEPERDSFVQEKLFSFGDTAPIEELPLDNGRPSFDDFADLSDKINSGEIRIESDGDDNKDQLSFVSDDDMPPLNGTEEDEADGKDKKLRMVFDMMNGEEEPEIESEHSGSALFKKASTAGKAKKERKKQRRIREEEEPAYEYKNVSQRDEVFSMLRRATAIYRLKFIGTVILSFLILYMELAAFDSDRSVYLRQGRMGAIYILIDLQLLCFSVMMMTRPFLDGLRAIGRWRLTTDSIMSLSVLVAMVSSAVALIVDPTDADLKLYNLVAALAICANCFVKFLQCKKDLACFRVVATKRDKFTAQPLNGVTGESNVFTGSLDGGSELFTVKKASFVSGFMARTNRRPKSEDVFNILVPVTFVAAVALFLVSYLNGNDVYSSFKGAALLFAAATPLTSFFMISLPAIAANLTAKRYSSALIGNAVVEEYADAAVLSFADTEAFPSNRVSINSVKTYGDYPIDEVIIKLAMLFNYIEGPLKSVTANMVDRMPTPQNVRLIDNDSDGLYIIMDGVDYYLGKRSYMLHSKLDAPVDQNDEAYSRNYGSVMYMAINSTVVAKIYIKYGISPGFDSLLESMYNAGVCVGIKTLDPNIDNELLMKSIKYKNCPVAVLKGTAPEEMNATLEKVDSGIVSASSLRNFLKMFILCDHARHATKSNCIINIAAILVTVFAVVFLTLTGDSANYNSLYVALFQLLWLLPTGLVSFLL